MKVLEAPEGLQAPSLCFLCEHSPRQGDDVVDVERSFSTFGASNLDGRKFVCVDCVVELARLFDFASPEDVQKMRDELAQAQAELEAADARSGIQAAVEAAVALFSVPKSSDPNDSDAGKVTGTLPTEPPAFEGPPVPPPKPKPSTKKPKPSTK